MAIDHSVEGFIESFRRRCRGRRVRGPRAQRGEKVRYPDINFGPAPGADHRLAVRISAPRMN